MPRHVLFHETDVFHPIEAVIITENNKTVQLFESFGYEWLVYINQTHLISTLGTYTFDKRYTKFFINDYNVPSKYEWIFSFPLSYFEFSLYKKVFTIFSEFIFYEKLPLCERLEKIVTRFNHNKKDELFKHIIPFIMKHDPKNPERMKILFSPILNSYI